jgi:hypothetical protein
VGISTEGAGQQILQTFKKQNNVSYTYFLKIIHSISITTQNKKILIIILFFFLLLAMFIIIIIIFLIKTTFLHQHTIDIY